MVEKAVIYGDIISRENRDKLKNNYPNLADRFSCRNKPTSLGSNSENMLIIVDLDDPRFADSNFLLSLTRDNNNTKLVGKADAVEQEAMIQFAKLGISEILDPDECLKKLDNFLNQLEQQTVIKEEKSNKFTAEAFMGVSDKVVEIRNNIMTLSEVDFPSALILGNTGTGKGLLAKILHNTGVRKNHNMVEVNCSAIPDELFETELFGRAKGAYTDAKTDKIGLFEYAQGGTLFLDEVGNLTASAQAKLLKILEDKKLRKIGDIVETEIDVRVVAATNLDLHKTVEKGRFREDLFFRLNLLTLEIPPLRERVEDIPDIARNYLTYYSTIYGRPQMTITNGAVAEMTKYDWPGNVRQLCNIIERAVLLSKCNIIDVGEIKSAVSKGRLTLDDRRQIVLDIPAHGVKLDVLEQNIIKHILNMCRWNKSETAKFLGISRPRLRRIIQSGGLEEKRNPD